MKRLIIAVFLTAATTLSGCAASSGSGDFHAPYISPTQFQTYTCGELSAEIERIQTRVNQLMGKQNGDGATKDKWTLGTDLSLSWAALFALGGTKEQEAEYAQLKSEYDAIQKSAFAKKCPDAIPPIDNPPEFDPNLVKELGSDRTTSHQ
ncbi:hypothetical protein C8R34_10648 [Nitrosomonas sp. Nm84]|uniref:hypothetical protein n=1 Tax=Nitrosomonas sp. Nm84 TaxID=200124 RepID=UPI000D75FEE7|nr:hypothetical protein [Nitrosomonas sp. Nm84]PXW88900.1 hypothetical protein C8R34_10648 [Nitrosomonas sp. Nm84]